MDFPPLAKNDARTFHPQQHHRDDMEGIERMAQTILPSKSTVSFSNGENSKRSQQNILLFRQ